MIASDHPSVESGRVRVESMPGGRRLSVDAETAADLGLADAEDGVVRVVLDGHDRFARPSGHLTEDRLLVGGVFDGPESARERSGTDRLAEWLDSTAIGGETVLLDALEPGERYGLRAPGERVVYEERSTTDDSLASIAEDLDG